MLTKNEKGFFADTAWGASRLSTCSERRGAVLVSGRSLQATGHNRKILKDKDWEISAIYDVIFSCRHINLTGFILFSTCFPSFNDMKLIISVGISTIYFCGNVDDIEAVELTNGLPKNNISLEIINLK